LREIYVTDAGFYEAGRAIHEWLGQQDEIDTDQLAVRGVSMGALWCTQISTVIPTIKACAIAYPSYEQGEDTAFQMNSPTFKLRFMFMAGFQDEAEFDKFIQGINAHGLGEKVTCPYLVCSGEDDDWSSIESTFDVLNDVKTPKELLLYQGEGHTLHSRPSSYLGPNEFVYMADWIADRFKGRPMESVLSVVDATGRIHREPWGDRRSYDYGLPDLA
jgi:cephalosporin-C deacetylase-like acetyl esterase